MNAYGARPSGNVLVRQFCPCFPGLIIEFRAGFSGGIHFGVLVIIGPKTEVEIGKIAQGGFDSGLDVNARLPQVDERSSLFAMRFFLFGFLALFFVSLRIAVARNTALGVSCADRNADETALAYYGESTGAALDIQSASGQQAKGLLLLFMITFLPFFTLVALLFLVSLHGAQQRGFSKARNLVVVRIPGETIQMPGKAPGAAVKPERPVSGVGVVGPSQIQLAAQTLRRAMRYTAGVRIDHAADRAGTVQQGAGPLEYLHPIGDEGIHRPRVIAAGYGYVHSVDTVLTITRTRAPPARV